VLNIKGQIYIIIIISRIDVVDVFVVRIVIFLTDKNEKLPGV
jgi:hypothetical protein